MSKDYLNQMRKERQFAFDGQQRVELCEGNIEINGQKLVPDDYKAYVEFQISQGLQYIEGSTAAELNSLRGVTAYRSAMHPNVVAKSHGSMLHQVLNRGHEMKIQGANRDHNIGAIVGVEMARAPMSGWKVKGNGQVNPIIRAVAVIHKKADGVPKLLGEHLGGRHRWTVSQEVNYSVLDSGFLVARADKAKKKQKELLEQTPDEFSSLNYGYVPCTEAPDELLECYNFDKQAVDKEWDGLPVVLLKGGLDNAVAYTGVGMVRYGAEREAEIQQLMARDPNAFSELQEDGLIEYVEITNTFLGALKKIAAWE